MNIYSYPEIKPGKKIIKKLYVKIFLWITGKAFQAVARTDKSAKIGLEELSDDFAFSLGVLPDGPYLTVGKDKKNKIKYMGGNIKNKRLTLQLDIKNIEFAILLFTFRESTPGAFARNRFIVNGDISDAVTVSKVLDLVEIYLLPKVLAKRAVKRYPKWSQMSPIKKYIIRTIVYFRTFAGI